MSGGIMYDKLNQVCDAQAFTATAVSASSIDLLAAGVDPSIGRRMAFLVMATVAAGAGSSHVLAAIQADDAALTTNVEVLGQITVLAAALIPGARFEIPIPQGSITRRYIGIRDTISSGTTTVTLDAYFMPQDEITEYKSFTKVVDAEV